MAKKQKKVVELFIDENDPMWGVQAISVVDVPAIERDFVALKKHVALSKIKLNKERRMLYGPALVPDKEILRIDEETGERYWIKFSAETCRKAAHLFMRNNNHHNTTVQHAYAVNGNTVVENWVKESKAHDKSSALGFNEPVGTWFVGMYIGDDHTWELVQEKEVKGFSIEGFFTELAIKQTLDSDYWQRKEAAKIIRQAKTEDEAKKALIKFLG